jgi:hypothetical protein
MQGFLKPHPRDLAGGGMNLVVVITLDLIL